MQKAILTKDTEEEEKARKEHEIIITLNMEMKENEEEAVQNAVIIITLKTEMEQMRRRLCRTL